MGLIRLYMRSLEDQQLENMPAAFRQDASSDLHLNLDLEFCTYVSPDADPVILAGQRSPPAAARSSGGRRRRQRQPMHSRRTAGPARWCGCARTCACTTTPPSRRPRPRPAPAAARSPSLSCTRRRRTATTSGQASGSTLWAGWRASLLAVHQALSSALGVVPAPTCSEAARKC